MDEFDKIGMDLKFFLEIVFNKKNHGKKADKIYETCEILNLLV